MVVERVFFPIGGPKQYKRRTLTIVNSSANAACVNDDDDDCVASETQQKISRWTSLRGTL